MKAGPPLGESLVHHMVLCVHLRVQDLVEGYPGCAPEEFWHYPLPPYHPICTGARGPPTSQSSPHKKELPAAFVLLLITKVLHQRGVSLYNPTPDEHEC